MGAEAIRELLSKIDLPKLKEQLKRNLKKIMVLKDQKSLKDLETVDAFLNSNNKPE